MSSKANKKELDFCNNKKIMIDSSRENRVPSQLFLDTFLMASDFCQHAIILLIFDVCLSNGKNSSHHQQKWAKIGQNCKLSKVIEIIGTLKKFKTEPHGRPRINNSRPRSEHLVKRSKPWSEHWEGQWERPRITNNLRPRSEHWEGQWYIKEPRNELQSFL